MEEKIMVQIPAGYVCLSYTDVGITERRIGALQQANDAMTAELRQVKAELAEIRRDTAWYREFFADSINEYHKRCFEEFVAERHTNEIPKEF